MCATQVQFEKGKTTHEQIILKIPTKYNLKNKKELMNQFQHTSSYIYIYILMIINNHLYIMMIQIYKTVYEKFFEK